MNPFKPADELPIYDLLTRNLQDVLWSVDLTFRFTSMSPSILKLRGYTQQETLGQSVPDVLTPLSLATVLKALTEQLEFERQPSCDKGRFWKVDLEIACKDGRTIWTETKMTFLRSPEGKHAGVFGVTREVSVSREAESRIRLAEEKYKQIFENSAVAITVTDEQERIISWNKYAEDLLGMGREDLYMRSVHQLYPDDEWKRMQSLEIRKQGMLHHFETLVLKKDGSLLDVDVSVTVLKTSDGGKTGSIGIIQNIAERKQAERRLRLAEEKYRSVFENSATAITVTDEQERVIQWNKLAEKLFGFTAEELFLKPVRSLYPEEAWKAMQSMNIRSKGMVRQHETQAIRKDGTLIDIAISVTVLATPDGGKTGSIGIIEDITERKEAERKIRNAEEQYRTIFENSAVAITVTDEEERIISWNHLAEQLLGMGREDLHRRPVRNLYASEEWQRLQSMDLRKKGITQNVETQIIRKDGNKIDIDLCITVLRTPDGGKRGSIGIIRDITERKEAERKLRIAEEKYRTIFDNSPVAITIADKDGVIVSWNKFAEELLGRSHDELFGKTTESLYPADERGKIHALNIRQSGTAHFETKILKGGGELMDVKTSVSVLTDTEGRITGSIGIIRDITERNRMMGELKKSREQAESANHSKSDFLSNMSHEIRTPMNGILGMLDLLLETPLNGEQHEYATFIKNSADSLLTIINDILDFSKVEAGKLTLENIPFDLWTSVEDVASMLAVRAQEKGIELLVRFSPDTPRRVQGDPGRIRQILINLAGNAIKFTAKGYVLINVESLPKGGDLCEFKFSVEDTGIGIPPEKIDYVFEKFTQADTSTTRRYGGTGLGLAICKQLAALMGGKIGATSRVGLGSTFWFTTTCPLDRHAPKAIPKAELHGLNVLIVDDHEMNRRILIEELAGWGIQAEAVTCAEDALARLHKAQADGKPYQMALLDYQLPEMDGLTLAKAVKADAVLKKTVLIMLTSMGQRGDAKKMEEAGMAAYLVKPVRQGHLYETLSLAWGAHSRNMPVQLITRYTLKENQVQEKREAEAPVVISARILLAEDNLVNQKVARKMIEKLGCSVDVVASGLEALNKIRQNSYDLVFMDCQMPEMDGYEAAREIRKLPGAPAQVPIIALTANAMDGDREKCLEAGMNDYLCKPVKAEDLGRKIRHWRQEQAIAMAGTTSIAPVDSASANALCIDPARIAALKVYADESDVNFINELFETFFSSTEDRLAKIQEALEQETIASIHIHAHTIKGSGRNLGALRLARMAEELEKAGQHGLKEEAVQLLGELRIELDMVRQEFENKWRMRKSA